MRFFFLVIPLLGAFGCGSDASTPDRVSDVCGRIFDATCAKFVECKANPNGTVLTPALCAQARPNAIDQCRTKNGATISAGSDAEVDACIQGLEQFQCGNLCGQIPQD